MRITYSIRMKTQFSSICLLCIWNLHAAVAWKTYTWLRITLSTTYVYVIEVTIIYKCALRTLFCCINTEFFWMNSASIEVVFTRCVNFWKKVLIVTSSVVIVLYDNCVVKQLQCVYGKCKLPLCKLVIRVWRHVRNVLKSFM